MSAIRIGCCLSLNAAFEPRTGEEAIPIFAKVGFDYIEMPLAQTLELSEEKFRNLLGVIRANGIPMEACNNFFPARIRLTGEEARPEEALEYAKAALERAAAMGAEIIVFGSSGAKNIPPGFPYERARDQFIGLLMKLQDIARPFDITIALEPLNTKESNFINSVGEALIIVRELSLPNIKLLADYYHMRMEDEDQRVILEAGKDLRHTHIAAKEGRLCPKAGDGEDYGNFFTLLKAADYNGRVSVEGYSKDLAGDGEASLKLLRSLAESPKEDRV